MKIQKDFTKKGYLNFGDVNYLDYEGIFIKQIKDNEFYIIQLACDFDEITKKPIYNIGYCYIDITDSWIDNNKKSILSIFGMEESEINDKKSEYAYGILSYFGIYECSNGTDSEKFNSIKKAYSRLLQLINRE